MRTRLLAFLAALALAVTAGFVVGCGDDDDDDGGTDTGGASADLGLITEGQLLVGTDTPFPPFEIGKPPDLSGYDIEVVNAIADKIGLEVTYQDTSFDTIFRDTAQGKFDLAVAASTITPEREQTVDFSDPYYEANQSLMVATGSDIATVDDLGGKTVGAQDATTGEDYANEETGAAEVRGFPEGPDAINALRAGQVDAVIIDQPVALDAVESLGGGDIEIAQEIVTSELYGLAMAQESDALREAVNGALQEIKDDGILADLYEQYFPGVEVPATVLEGTNEPT
ncbi:MAG: basic amino acid ABC transporter substrate-binding protein [Actinomycetota bacterium]|nr:basic amino acid ABC transporter substrate-binding protein [Actinomycetota bacterium]